MSVVTKKWAEVSRICLLRAIFWMPFKRGFIEKIGILLRELQRQTKISTHN